MGVNGGADAPPGGSVAAVGPQHKQQQPAGVTAMPDKTKALRRKLIQCKGSPATQVLTLLKNVNHISFDPKIDYSALPRRKKTVWVCGCSGSYCGDAT